MLAASAIGCASLATRPVTAVDGVVRLALADHPELARPLGTLKVLPAGERDPLFVLALEDNQFAVLSSVCTHRGCTVDAQDRHLVCPCHGSTYDRTGVVLRGPAERPLRRFASRVVGGSLEIVLRDPS
jgi:Rieske Fe-S protein